MVNHAFTCLQEFKRFFFWLVAYHTYDLGRIHSAMNGCEPPIPNIELCKWSFCWQTSYFSWLDSDLDSLQWLRHPVCLCFWPSIKWAY
jgi:hypothetical protein